MRCLSVVLTLALSLCGCEVGVSSGPPVGALPTDAGAAPPVEGPPGEAPGGRLIFEAEVLALLLAECGSCHEDPASGPAFLQGPDVYAEVLAWPALVVPGEPASSRLVTTGAHRGPALRPSSDEAVRAWIAAEGLSGAGPGAGPERPGTPPPGGQPTALFEVIPAEVDPLSFTFDASASTDADGTIEQYRWSFGDGAADLGVAVTHLYAGPNTFAVQLTVTDDDGGSATTTQVIDVGTGAPRVVRFVLIDTDTDTEIPEHTPLSGGAVVDRTALPPNLTIRADTVPAEVGSLRFSYDGEADFHRENRLPYAINGDDAGDFVPFTLEPGTHTLAANASTEPDGGGTVGPPLTISFVVR